MKKWVSGLPILTQRVDPSGIPWYENMILWCNSSALFWPEIPVIISIAWATFVMGAVCIGVIKTERKTRRYAAHAQTHSISTMVVKQSLLFVGAFYVTWVPYLALQVRTRGCCKWTTSCHEVLLIFNLLVLAPYSSTLGLQVDILHPMLSCSMQLHRYLYKASSTASFISNQDI